MSQITFYPARLEEDLETKLSAKMKPYRNPCILLGVVAQTDPIPIALPFRMQPDVIRMIALGRPAVGLKSLVYANIDCKIACRSRIREIILYS